MCKTAMHFRSLYIPLYYDCFYQFQCNSKKGVDIATCTFGYEVKPTVNCVVADVVLGISYTYMV